MEALPRSRLDSTEPLYVQVADLADRLDSAGQDLWAANLRACLRGNCSTQVLADLGMELHRLRQSNTVRRLRWEGTIEGLIATVQAAVGQPDHPHLPLYCSLKDLLDELRLAGSLPWVRRLEEAGDRDPATRVAAVATVLDEMVPDASTASRPSSSAPAEGPGAPGVLSGLRPRVEGSRQRLARTRDSAAASRSLAAALRRLS
ncbi:MAG: hypothetical protein ACRDZO_17605 [Egibacteraceae bacterium]